MLFYLRTKMSIASNPKNYPQNQNFERLESEIIKIEKELNLLQKDLFSMKQNLLSLKKLIVFNRIKDRILQSSFFTFEKNKSYFDLRKNFLLYSNLYYALYNDLIKKEKELQNLTFLYKKKLEENKKLKEKYYEELLKKKKENIIESKFILTENRKEKFLFMIP